MVQKFSFLLFIAVVTFLAHADDSASIRQMGYCCTGFGVPGSGTPVVDGKIVIVPAGEGYATVCDVSNPKNPHIARYIPAWYFTSIMYPLLSRNIAYLSNSRGPLLYLDTLKNVSVTGTPKESSWNPAWGRSFLSGLAPDGTGYTVVKDSILVIDFNDPLHLREITRISQPRLKSDAKIGSLLLSFSKDFKVSAMMLDSSARIGIFKWKDRTKPILESEIENSDGVINKKPSFGSVSYIDEKWLIVSHMISQPVNKATKVFREISFWDISRISKPRLVCKKVFYDPKTIIRGLDVSGSLCYAADGKVNYGQHVVQPDQRSRILVLDLNALETDTAKSNTDTLKLAPKTTTAYEDTMPTEYSNIKINGKMLYVNDYNYGLWVFDASKPYAVNKVCGLPTSAEGHWVYVAKDYAYMAHTFGAVFHIINLNP